MSRKLLAFLLNELNIVRIKCMKCERVSEMPISSLGSFQASRCPFCQQPLVSVPAGHPMNPLKSLAEAIGNIQLQAGSVEVEFVIPDTSK
jgi:formate dehydrogenase maturation protein FdhE